MIDDIIEGSEDPVREPVLAHEQPDIFLTVEFGRTRMASAIYCPALSARWRRASWLGRAGRWRVHPGVTLRAISSRCSCIASREETADPIRFVRFVTIFTDEPEISRISPVLGYSRNIFARFFMHQDLQTLLRCRMLAFCAIGDVPIVVL